MQYGLRNGTKQKLDMYKERMFSVESY